MSKRRHPGEVVKHEGKYYQLPLEPLFTDYQNQCCLCDDPRCMNWDILYVLGNLQGWKHHIPECQMEDDDRKERT